MVQLIESQSRHDTNRSTIVLVHPRPWITTCTCIMAVKPLTSIFLWLGSSRLTLWVCKLRLKIHVNGSFRHVTVLKPCSRNQESTAGHGQNGDKGLQIDTVAVLEWRPQHATPCIRGKIYKGLARCIIRRSLGHQLRLHTSYANQILRD
jgi:hypothetical protein